ncbi:MAG TPA: response regulator [Anaerolineae bacterium]|nr:response regulator [Anaerolineae bacterium]
MSGEIILVADDRRENLLFLANSVLRPEGYEVITAIDGKQALDKALAEKPDLVITDLKMPRMSGLELIAALRKAGSDVAVILTTFYGSEQAAIQAFRLGARDYIVKPYDVKEMLESVERALIERRLRRETTHLQEGAEVSRHLEERVRQLHSLCGIGQALHALVDADEVMRVAVEAAIYLTDAVAGQLFLFDEAHQQLELRAIRGPSDTRARCVRQPGAEEIALQAARTGRAVTGERSTGRKENAPRLAVPLRHKEDVVGVLAVDALRQQAFDDNDRYQLGILATFVTGALGNASRVEKLNAQVLSLAGQLESRALSSAGGVPPTMMADSIAEAERLSRELRNLAAAAQVLAARLQLKNNAQQAASAASPSASTAARSPADHPPVPAAKDL